MIAELPLFFHSISNNVHFTQVCTKLMGEMQESRFARALDEMKETKDNRAHRNSLYDSKRRVKRGYAIIRFVCSGVSFDSLLPPLNFPSRATLLSFHARHGFASHFLHRRSTRTTLTNWWWIPSTTTRLNARLEFSFSWRIEAEIYRQLGRN